MKIHADYPGGNIKVISIDGYTVNVENELRTTKEDWFYFSFCVEGAEGKTLTFNFINGRNRIGYWGPAISYDYKAWHWLDIPGASTPFSFTYTFGPGESKVYFSQGIQYMPERFDALAEEIGLVKEKFSLSLKGRQMYSYTLGTGEKEVILASRHHACEATGTYIIEGVLRELSEKHQDFLKKCKIFTVPFMDFDGVVDGDQGKGRVPDGFDVVHDHNRDYIDKPFYDACDKMQKRFESNSENILGVIDCHSPWIFSGINDKVFVIHRDDVGDKIVNFSKLFVEESKELPFRHHEEDFFPANTQWNSDLGPKCITSVVKRVPNCKFAFTLETAYYGTEGNKATQESIPLLGRALGRSIVKSLS